MSEGKGFPRWLVFVLAFAAVGVVHRVFVSHQRERALERGTSGGIDAAFARGSLQRAIAALCDGGDALLCEHAEPLRAANPESCEERIAAVEAVDAQLAAFVPQATAEQKDAIAQAAARMKRVQGCPQAPTQRRRGRR